MALDEPALPELFDALRAADGVDLIRDAVRLVMQELIELEVADAIGAATNELTPARTNATVTVNGRWRHRPAISS